MAKTLSFVLALLPDGTLDVPKCDALYAEIRDQIKAEMDTDFNSVAVGINAFLLVSPGRTYPTSSFVQALYDANLENGVYVHPESIDDAGNITPAKPFTRQEKDLARSRLEIVIPEYVKSLPNQFHVGRKTGVAIRFAVGETMKDGEGNETYDAEGNTVQAFRHTAEEWAKVTTPSEKELAKRALIAAEEAKALAAKAAK